MGSFHVGITIIAYFLPSSVFTLVVYHGSGCWQRTNVRKQIIYCGHFIENRFLAISCVVTNNKSVMGWASKEPLKHPRKIGLLLSCIIELIIEHLAIYK